MRIKKTLINSIYAVVSYILLAFLALLVRKVFVQTLTIELLGYEGLFGNLLSIVSLADLGIESVILYRMFPAFAKQDKIEINKMMNIYRNLYSIIGIVILIVGIIVIPFLRYLIIGNNLNWNYIYIIYLVQLSITLCTYFLAYKRLLFIVNQQEFECTKVDALISLIFYILKIIVLLAFKNYILYLCCNFGTNLLSNLVISRKVKKAFPYLSNKGHINKQEIKTLGIWRDIKNNIVQKVCLTIYGSTDNILISALLGIDMVGMLSNYTLIQSYVTNFTIKLLRPFQMSIGNYIYTTDAESGYKTFCMFDLISFFISCTISSCYLCVFNPFIELWFGENYKLEMLFVISFSINQYILWNHHFVCLYRNSFGKYETDKKYVLLAAILNLLFSILLCKPLGISGIMIGTAIGHLGFWIGRVKVVYQEYIHEKKALYFQRQIIRIIIWIGELIFCYEICNLFPLSWIGILERIGLCILLTFLLNLLMFSHSIEMKTAIDYVKRIIKMIKTNGKETCDFSN